MAKLPEKPSHTLDELNISRLGLISAQRQVSSDFKSWETTYLLDDQPVKVVCKSSEVVPHGVDTEVYLGILKSFVSAGSPGDGKVIVTPRELLMASGMPGNSRAYQVLRQSLSRLFAATYTVDRAWRDHRDQRWMTVHFRHLNTLAYTKNAEHHLDSASLIEITLPAEVVKSINDGYLNPLNDQVLKELKQPSATALYRTLEAMRRDPVTLEVREHQLEINVVAWGAMLHFSDTDPKLIRRSLESPHKELLNTGYLKNAEYRGRGQKQVICYAFPQEEPEVLTPESQNLLQALMARGLTAGSARGFLKTHPAQLADALEVFDRLKASGYPMRSPGGLLASIIEQPERYPNHALDEKPVSEKSTSRAKAVQATLDLPEFSLEEKIRAIRMLLKSDLNLVEMDVLTDLMKAGKLDPQNLQDQLAQAVMNKNRTGFVGQLKEDLLRLTGK